MQRKPVLECSIRQGLFFTGGVSDEMGALDMSATWQMMVLEVMAGNMHTAELEWKWLKTEPTYEYHNSFKIWFLS